MNASAETSAPSATPVTSVTWATVVVTTLRLLTFRATREELVSLTGKHLAFGLVCTWIVGMGRYWDNPRVGLLQHLGIGSVVYVFVLAWFLWLIAAPLRPKHWSYRRVLAFVSLVSPPAILYALPVEKYFPLDTANSFNVWLLAIVAIWRVALLLFFLRRVGELNWFSIIIAALLPLTFIVVGLTVLNLEKAVFDFMGGITRPGTASDEAYAVLFTLSFFSFILFVPLIICYIVLIGVAAQREQYKKIYDQ